MRSVVVVLTLLPLLFAVCGVSHAQTDICGNAVTTGGVIVACPQGDGPTLAEQGMTITVQVFQDGQPLVGAPASSFWLMNPFTEPGSLLPCPTSPGLLHPHGPTDQNGFMIFSGALEASSCCFEFESGCGQSLWINSVYGLLDDCNTGEILEIPMKVRSVDLTGDHKITAADLSTFALHFPPNPYSDCVDYNGDGVIDLRDLAIFSIHFGPPGHQCSP